MRHTSSMRGGENGAARPAAEQVLKWGVPIQSGTRVLVLLCGGRGTHVYGGMVGRDAGTDAPVQSSMESVRHARRMDTRCRVGDANRRRVSA